MSLEPDAVEEIRQRHYWLVQAAGDSYNFSDAHNDRGELLNILQAKEAEIEELKGANISLNEQNEDFRGRLKPPMGARDLLFESRSYPEDLSDFDRGNYFCICRTCRLPFQGFKRRIICKSCKLKLVPSIQDNA